MKRFARRRSAAAVFALVVSVCVLLTTMSNAASLQLIGDGSIAFAQSAERCTTGPLTVSPSGTPTAGQHNQVTVSGISGDCAGGNVSVYLAGTPHTVLFSGGGTVTGSTMTVSSGAFTAPATADAAVVVGLDGWAIPATWEHTPPVSAAACVVTQGVTGWVNNQPVLGSPRASDTCAVTSQTRTNSWQSGGVSYEEWSVTVRNTGSHEIVWRVDLNFGSSPFPAWAVRAVNGLGPTGSWNGLVQTGCADLPRLSFIGNNYPWNTTLEPGEAHSVSFQIASAPVAGWGLRCP